MSDKKMSIPSDRILCAISAGNKSSLEGNTNYPLQRSIFYESFCVRKYK
jgi:hypothetical protein